MNDFSKLWILARTGGATDLSIVCYSLPHGEPARMPAFRTREVAEAYLAKDECPPDFCAAVLAELPFGKVYRTAIAYGVNIAIDLESLYEPVKIIDIVAGLRLDALDEDLNLN